MAGNPLEREFVGAEEEGGVEEITQQGALEKGDVGDVQ